MNVSEIAALVSIANYAANLANNRNIVPAAERVLIEAKIKEINAKFIQEMCALSFKVETSPENLVEKPQETVSETTPIKNGFVKLGQLELNLENTQANSGFAEPVKSSALDSPEELEEIKLKVEAAKKSIPATAKKPRVKRANDS